MTEARILQEMSAKGLSGKYAVPITLINHSRNFGEHNAVMTGLRYAQGEYVITIDDDLQNPPGEIVRLFNYTRHGAYDVVYTWFKEKNTAHGETAGSRLTNKMADILLDKPKGTLSLHIQMHDCFSG